MEKEGGREREREGKKRERARACAHARERRRERDRKPTRLEDVVEAFSHACNTQHCTATHCNTVQQPATHRKRQA